LVWIYFIKKEVNNLQTCFWNGFLVNEIELFFIYFSIWDQRGKSVGNHLVLSSCNELFPSIHVFSPPAFFWITYKIKMVLWVCYCKVLGLAVHVRSKDIQGHDLYKIKICFPHKNRLKYMIMYLRNSLNWLITQCKR
jgi:hypothetical protein